MTNFTRIPAVFVNPVVLALLTSSLGIGASLAQSYDVTARPTPTVVATVVDQSESPTQATSDWRLPTPPPQPTDAELTLARRFTQALTSKSRTHSPVAPTKTTLAESTTVAEASPVAEITTRTWVCGAWEDLVQGRGQARSCEWR